jgi:hypothetical protein
VASHRPSSRSLPSFARGVRLRREVRLHALDLRVVERERVAIDLREFLLDEPRERLDAGLLHEDLDPRLELVVATPELVVRAEHRLGVREQIALRQERADALAEDRRPAEPTADEVLEPDLAALVRHQMEPDVVDRDRRAIGARAGDRDLELARKVRELGMERRPLPEDLAVGPRILELVARHAGQRIAGDVPDAVPARLDRVHLHARELVEDVGHVDQRRPVELHVLPRGEVRVAAIVAPRDLGELPQLGRGQEAVGDRDPQHVRVELEVEPVLEAERPELLLGELVLEPTPHLIAELKRPLLDDPLIVLVVPVHQSIPRRRLRTLDSPAARSRSRAERTRSPDEVSPTSTG